jgi:hypothetical protein
LTWQFIYFPLNLYLIHIELKYDVFNFNGAKESNSIATIGEASWQSFQPDEQEEVRDTRRQYEELISLSKFDEYE